MDYVTARDIVGCFRKVLPEYAEDDLWEISDELMMQVNASYGPMTPDTAATQSLAGTAPPPIETNTRRALASRANERARFFMWLFPRRCTIHTRLHRCCFQ